MPKLKRDATFDDLLVQMKITNRLLAAPLKQSMGQQALVRLLASTGAGATEIADVLDTTPATIATTIQRIRRKSRGSDNKDDAKSAEGEGHSNA